MGKASTKKSEGGRSVLFDSTRRELYLKHRAERLDWSKAMCADAVGIANRTLCEWIAVGKGQEWDGREVSDERRAEAVRFVQDLERVEAERLEAVLDRALQRVIEAGASPQVTRTTKTTTVGDKVVEEVVTEKVAPPIWTADAWLLERLRKEIFSKRTEVSGVGLTLTPTEADRLVEVATDDELGEIEAGNDQVLRAVVTRMRGGRA